MNRRATYVRPDYDPARPNGAVVAVVLVGMVALFTCGAVLVVEVFAAWARTVF